MLAHLIALLPSLTLKVVLFVTVSSSLLFVSSSKPSCVVTYADSLSLTAIAHTFYLLYFRHVANFFELSCTRFERD